MKLIDLVKLPKKEPITYDGKYPNNYGEGYNQALSEVHKLLDRELILDEKELGKFIPEFYCDVPMHYKKIKAIHATVTNRNGKDKHPFLVALEIERGEDLIKAITKSKCIKLK